MIKQAIPTSTPPPILRELANHRKWKVYQYIVSARFASASVIVRRCGILQPSVSRYLKSMTGAGLLTKTKIGSVTIYEADQKTSKLLAGLELAG